MANRDDHHPFAIRYSPFAAIAKRSHSLLRIQYLSFAGLVVLARSLNPIPSRTRPLNSSAPMVLWLKPWESRSLPGLQRTDQNLFTSNTKNAAPAHKPERRFCVGQRRSSRSPSEPVKPERGTRSDRDNGGHREQRQRDPEDASPPPLGCDLICAALLAEHDPGGMALRP
jgi:hypothetical protein